MILALAVAAAGVQFSGRAFEISYSAECAPGPRLVERPAVGRKVVVRPGKANSRAAPVAEATVGSDGTYHLPPVVGEGDFCIVPADSYGATGPCLEQFKGAVEGMHQVDLRFAARRRTVPPACPKLTVQVTRQEDSCGDGGQPAAPVPGVFVDIHEEKATRSQHQGRYATSPEGKFTALLNPGRYCVRAVRESDTYLPPECKDECDGWVEWDAKTDASARVLGHRRCGGKCAVGRAQVGEGTHHVKGLTYTPNVPAWGCGALHPASPSRVNPGALVVVRALDDPSKSLAEVHTDATGFDVALPVGEFCFLVGPNDPKAACLYTTRITGGSDPIEGVRLVPPVPKRPYCPPGVP